MVALDLLLTNNNNTLLVVDAIGGTTPKEDTKQMVDGGDSSSSRNAVVRTIANHGEEYIMNKKHFKNKANEYCTVEFVQAQFLLMSKPCLSRVCSKSIRLSLWHLFKPRSSKLLVTGDSRQKQQRTRSIMQSQKQKSQGEKK